MAGVLINKAIMKFKEPFLEFKPLFERGMIILSFNLGSKSKQVMWSKNAIIHLKQTLRIKISAKRLS
jgi:hypothetical protein